MSPAILLSLMAMFGATAAVAQQDTTPTPASQHAADDATAMHMTPEEMLHMQSSSPAAQPLTETHAPDPILERPALSEHVVPPVMTGMDADMNDAAITHRIWIENAEAIFGTGDGGAWDGQAWLGGDFDKLWIKSEGATLRSKTVDAKVEALWAHAVLPFWDTQLGVRHDFSGGPSREWVAFGVQGISSYWFDVELTGYFGEEGRTALRLKTEYDLYLTERLVLKPEIELNVYGKPDQARQIGAGLNDGEFELRLRYELSRRFAPYAGYVYQRKFAGSAISARLNDEPAVNHRVVAGLDFFF